MPDQMLENSEPVLEVQSAENGNITATILLWAAMIFAIVATGFLVFYKYYTDSQIKDKQTNLTSLTDQIKSSKNATIVAKANDVNSAVSVLSKAQTSKFLFKTFIDEFITKVTNDIQLKNLSIDQTGKIVMDGQAGSYRSVADLATALSSSASLKNVQIISVSESAQDNKIVTSFSMAAEIQGWGKSNITVPATTTNTGGTK